MAAGSWAAACVIEVWSYSRKVVMVAVAVVVVVELVEVVDFGRPSARVRCLQLPPTPPPLLLPPYSQIKKKLGTKTP